MSDGRKNHMTFEDWLENLSQDLGRQPWITAYRANSSTQERLTFWCALVPENRVEQVLASSSWDLMIGDGKPGCSVRYEDGNERVTYHRYGDDDEIEPLIIARDFHGIKQNYKEVQEEFRLFHNLYLDTRSGRLIKIDDEGEEEEVVVFDDDTIRVRSLPLRQYLAVRKMVLAVYFDLYRYSEKTLEELGIEETREDRAAGGRGV